MRLARRLWGREDVPKRFAVEVVVYLVLMFSFMGTYYAGIEAPFLLGMVGGAAGIMVADVLGFVGFYFWEGR